MEVGLRDHMFDRGMNLAAIGIAVCLPLAPALLPPLLILLAITAFWPRLQRSGKGMLRAEGPLFWMLLLYLLHLVGLLWTKNMDFAGLDLGIKAPLLVFPLIFLLGRPLRGVARIQRWFILANVLAVLICTVRALFTFTLNVSATTQPGAEPMSAFALSVPFFSSEFAFFLHPTYMAMYLTWALILFLRPDPERSWNVRWSVVFGLLLLLGVLLCASKAGWLLLFLAGIGTLVERWSDRKLRRTVIIGLSAVFALGLVLYSTTEYVHERVEQVVNALMDDSPKEDAANSTDDRRLVWRAAGFLVAEQPLLGVGTGDVKDEMLRMYAERGYIEPLTKKLNAHDQYLNTAVALGLVGAALLLLMILIPAVSAFRRRDVLLIFFLLLNALNWIVESMLEVQAGVMFFAFFAWIYTLDSRRTLLPRTNSSATSTP